MTKKFIDPLVLHDVLCEAAKTIMMVKNHDYRGGSDDPYKNFRGSKQFDIDPIIGILLRMQDKMMRIQTFVEAGALLVKDESVTDAIHDIINYAVLIGGLVDEAKTEILTKEVTEKFDEVQTIQKDRPAPWDKKPEPLIPRNKTQANEDEW